MPFFEGRSADATLVFEALPALAPVSPSTQARASQQASSEFTQIFTPIAPPASPAPLRQPEITSPSEFTQVFSAIPSPAAPQPDVRPVPQPSSGEFTQFFSAVSQRENAATASPQGPSATDVPFATPIAAAALGAAAPSAGAFTQQFQSAPVPPQAVEAPPPAAEAGSFTQIFQQIAPPPTGTSAGAPPVRPPARQPVEAARPPSASAPEWPAFGPPPPADGTFTDVFAAQRPLPPVAAAQWPSPAQPSAAPRVQAEALTELFQAVPPAQRPPETSPFAGYAAASAPGNKGWPPPSSQQAPAWPAAAAASPQPLVPGGSDFTRLMQSLSASPAAGGTTAPANDSFFAPPSASAPVFSQESEFTRVQRGSAQRDSSVPATPSTPPAGSRASGPGIALEQDKAAPEAAGKPGKSKLLIVLLVVMNSLLLIALIVVAFLFLHKK
ncbi:MAG: hypothetical protein ACRYHB_06985 [Janthinobacterium lividum]